jgi:CRP/FNR family transcriptional regulator
MTTLHSAVVPLLPHAHAHFPAAQLQQNAFDPEILCAHVEVLRRRLEPGQYLYRAGQPFRALFFIKLGSVKLCELAEDGREQISGFRLQGELVGAESIGLGGYACDVIALETSEIWELPYPPVLTACARIPEMQLRLIHALAQDIRRDRAWMLALGTLSAEQRVATFLLDLAARYQELGYSNSHFILRMCRTDIASYLALKHETVSRALGTLIDAGCIEVQRRELRILDHAALSRIAGASARAH